jgi:predicted amino acid-binding ACT domain protein
VSYGGNRSCYTRHLKDIIAEAGIELTPADRKRVDQAFHRIVGVDYKDCPATWKKLKPELTNEQKRLELVQKLKDALAGQ